MSECFAELDEAPVMATIQATHVLFDSIQRHPQVKLPHTEFMQEQDVRVVSVPGDAR